METENWKDIEEYKGLYQVSDQGRIKALGNGGSYNSIERILKQGRSAKNRKYWMVSLCKNGRIKSLTVHRLVAQAFIPNPDSLPFINHKDENPSNNRVENLEWCTAKYNCNYGTRNQRMAEANINHPSYSKKVLQFTKLGELIKEYPSTMEVERQTGIKHNNISACCSGKRKSAGGYIWKYATE